MGRTPSPGCSLCVCFSCADIPGKDRAEQPTDGGLYKEDYNACRFRPAGDGNGEYESALRCGASAFLSPEPLQASRFNGRQNGAAVIG